MLGQAGRDDIERLRSHARECHERSPGPPAAEAWYVFGCALLNAQRPEEATRAFQLACHAHPGLESATLLAFTCLKTRASDMPELLRLLVETHGEIGSPPLRCGRWERCLLDGLHTPHPSGERLSDLARALMSLPIACLREQMGAAMESQPGWSACLLAVSHPPVSHNGHQQPEAQHARG